MGSIVACARKGSSYAASTLSPCERPLSMSPTFFASGASFLPAARRCCQISSDETIAFGAVIPNDRERVEPALCRPHVIAHDTTRSSSTITFCTPGTFIASLSSTWPTRPPKTGLCAMVANFMPGSIASMPYTTWPLTFFGVSKRLNGLPMILKSFGFSALDFAAANPVATSTNAP